MDPAGKRVLEAVAKEEPAVFLKVVAGVMPRLIDIDASVSVHSELTIEAKDFAEAYRLWGEHIGVKGMPVIEAEVVEEEQSRTRRI